MGLADTANLIVDLSLKGNFRGQLKAASGEFNKFDSQLGRTQTRAYRAGQQIGTGILNAGKIAAVGIGILGSQVALGVRELITLEQAQAQTTAALKSTGRASGQTAQSIRSLAEKYESLNAIIDDKTIQAGENLILTFTNIRKNAFEPTLKAALDMATAMHQDLQPTIIQLGKALNDPAKGLTALRRVGVAFSAQQEKRIKALQKEGKLYEAQKLILAEVNKEFGGSFLAQGQTTAGKVAKFTDSIADLQKALATALLPTIGNVATALSSFLSQPDVIAGAKALGEQLGSLFSKQNLAEAGKAIGGAFNTLKQSLPAIQAGLGTVVGLVKGAVSAFQSLPPEIQQLAVAGFAVNKLTGGLVTNVAGGIVGAILGRLRSAVVNVQGAVVNVNGGIPGAGVPGGGAAGGALGLLGAAGIAAVIVAAAVPIGKAFADALPAEFKGRPGQTGKTESQIASEFYANVRRDARAGDSPAIRNQTMSDRGLDSHALQGMTRQLTGALAAGISRGLARGFLSLSTITRNISRAAIKERSIAKFGPDRGGRASAVEKTLNNNINRLIRAVLRRNPTVEGKLNELAKLQRQVLARGDVKAAAHIGKRIADLRSKTAQAAAKAAADASALKAKAAVQTAATRAGAQLDSNATHQAGGQIVGAIRANRPITTVNVTVNVTAARTSRAVTVQNRYGPGNGSSGGGNPRSGSQPT